MIVVNIPACNKCHHGDQFNKIVANTSVLMSHDPGLFRKKATEPTAAEERKIYKKWLGLFIAP